ncbi:uncharacterized protein MONOS_12637 [Monocercomonoides exilis]|uniref:uncharacterized protein n=1 Tax=Monocercomonoides exilis TaxID=2049356 RepID=UPI00355A836F|nr:hypothetical protein MONOS_12637 [Monocercomonoides exilis]|eukprot:MONOS_12637.1-p1 / transcript=MONOS_12637.1 / gene=MONOS_12637 / organism=Monocercomonoides_exilis_PA203 / gene_product=unspecified product / transcript_product=unspecified product / location=Mono_scaffold00712:24702-25792(+) / protein_length=292 / sequence_SO=supercontig / SO=protein_coding / is_pseudo=false
MSEQNQVAFPDELRLPSFIEKIRPYLTREAGEMLVKIVQQYRAGGISIEDFERSIGAIVGEETETFILIQLLLQFEQIPGQTQDIAITHDVIKEIESYTISVLKTVKEAFKAVRAQRKKEREDQKERNELRRQNEKNRRKIEEEKERLEDVDRDDEEVFEKKKKVQTLQFDSIIEPILLKSKFSQIQQDVEESNGMRILPSMYGFISEVVKDHLNNLILELFSVASYRKELDPTTEKTYELLIKEKDLCYLSETAPSFSIPSVQMPRLKPTSFNEIFPPIESILGDLSSIS